MPEGSKLSVVAGDALAAAREKEAAVFALPSLPFLVTSKALRQDYHQPRSASTTLDRWFMVVRAIAASGQKIE